MVVIPCALKEFVVVVYVALEREDQLEAPTPVLLLLELEQQGKVVFAKRIIGIKYTQFLGIDYSSPSASFRC